MELHNLLFELRIPITGKTKAGKKLRMYRGINFLVLDEQEPPDVHGIPKEMEAYGRGWLEDDQIMLDGGPQGSNQGHPKTAKQGFYWAADYDKLWKDVDGNIKKGVLYIRGRAGTSKDWLERNVIKIIQLIFERLPR